MIDGVIAGTGNSRKMKSSFTGTFQDFLDELAAGTFPFDLNGIDAAGWATIGTVLNKANLLDDTTAAALGGVNTVNEALAAVRPLALGGTGATTAEDGLNNLINGASAPVGGADATDYIGLSDTSEATGAKITLSDLLSWFVSSNSVARVEKVSRVGTGTQNTWVGVDFNFVPSVVLIYADTTVGDYSAAFGCYIENAGVMVVIQFSGTTLVASNNNGVRITGTRFEWYSGYQSRVFNYSGVTYRCVAIG